MAFTENESVRALLHVAGSEGLPLVLVEGVTILTGSYPKRSQLATWSGLAALTTSDTPSTSAVPAGLQSLEAVDAGACCSPDPGNGQTCC